MFFLRAIAHFHDKPNFVFDGKPKMTKNLVLKFQNLQKNNDKKIFNGPPKNLFCQFSFNYQLLIEFSIFIRFYNAYTVYFLHFAPIFQNNVLN